jgi:hypothetical protein
MNFDAWHKPWPLGVLLFGLLMVILAVIGSFTGRLYGRGSCTVRAEAPFTFWLTLVVQTLCGFFLIFYWLVALSR